MNAGNCAKCQAIFHMTPFRCTAEGFYEPTVISGANLRLCYHHRWDGTKGQRKQCHKETVMLSLFCPSSPTTKCLIKSPVWRDNSGIHFTTAEPVIVLNIHKKFLFFYPIVHSLFCPILSPGNYIFSLLYELNGGDLPIEGTERQVY